MTTINKTGSVDIKTGSSFSTRNKKKSVMLPSSL